MLTTYLHGALQKVRACCRAFLLRVRACCRALLLRVRARYWVLLLKIRARQWVLLLKVRAAHALSAQARDSVRLSSQPNARAD